MKEVMEIMIKDNNLTVKDFTINTFQAIIKGIPFVGASLEHFIFGPLAEIRMRRIEKTLFELAEHYGPYAPHGLLFKEEFVNLLERISPSLSRASNEDKRQRFRDLLINSAILQPGSKQWDETHLASDLLQAIDPPGLAILATLARVKNETVTLSSRPVPQVYEGDDFDYDKPQGPQHMLQYEWIVIEEWAIRLREMRLISFHSRSALGGFGGVQLTALGNFLVKWTLVNESS
jgi:hypothetical protein